MKAPKKFDVLIFAALFITVGCLAVTVVLQHSIKKSIAVINIESYTKTTVSKFAASPSAENSQPISSSVSDTDAASENASVSVIDYKTTSPYNTLTAAKTTKSATAKATSKSSAEKSTQIDSVLIVNKNTKKIHSSTCSYAVNTKDENKFTITSDELQSYLDNGYTLCSRCHGYKEQ